VCSRLLVSSKWHLCLACVCFSSRDFLLAWAAVPQGPFGRKGTPRTHLPCAHAGRPDPCSSPVPSVTCTLFPVKCDAVLHSPNFTPRTSGSVDEKQTASELLRLLCLSTLQHALPHLCVTETAPVPASLILDRVQYGPASVSLQLRPPCRPASPIGNHLHLRNCHSLHSLLQWTICQLPATLSVLATGMHPSVCCILLSAFLLSAWSCAIAVIPRFCHSDHNNNICAEQQARHRPGSVITTRQLNICSTL
jgi:hypothetical protein